MKIGEQIPLTLVRLSCYLIKPKIIDCLCSKSVGKRCLVMDREAGQGVLMYTKKIKCHA